MIYLFIFSNVFQKKVVLSETLGVKTICEKFLTNQVLENIKQPVIATPSLSQIVFGKYLMILMSEDFNLRHNYEVTRKNIKIWAWDTSDAIVPYNPDLLLKPVSFKINCRLLCFFSIT